MNEGKENRRWALDAEIRFEAEIVDDLYQKTIGLKNNLGPAVTSDADPLDLIRLGYALALLHDRVKARREFLESNPLEES